MQCLFGEKVAWLCTQLAADDVLVKAVVTVDAYVADVSLRTFLDAHLEVDAVAHDVHLCWLQVVEQVAVVPIHIAHGIFILRQAFLHQLLVVDITLVHAQHAAQLVGRVHGVAHPRDVTKVILRAFVHFDVDADMLVVDIPYAVFQDGGVSIAVFVVFVDKLLLVFLPTFRGELLGFEESGELAGLVRFRQGALLEQSAFDFRVLQCLVSLDDNLAHFHLLLLVDVDVEYHLILASDVFALVDGDFSVFESFVIEVFLGKDLCAVNHVRCNLATLEQTQFSLHVFALRLLQSCIVNSGYARTRGQVDVQVYLVADE